MSDALTINQAFSYSLESSSEREKLALATSSWIKDRLREESFTRQILTPQNVTRADLQVSVKHDTLVKIVEVEPDSRAMILSFRGEPDAQYIRGNRFEVPLFVIGSPTINMTEDELEAYTMPVQSIIKKNAVKDMQELVDHTFLTHCESAVQSTQKEANGLAFTAGFTDTTACSAFNVNAGTCVEVGKVKANDVLFQTSGSGAAASAAAGINQGVGTGVAPIIVPIQKDDLTKLFKTFPGDGDAPSRLRADQFLITDNDVEDINNWTTADVGDKIAEGTTMDGMKAKKLLGRKFIRTLKTDILRPGNVFAFAHEDYLGGYLTKGGPKFYADKRRNRISWEAWENVGLYIGNTAGVRKLELYACATDAMASGSTANTNALAKYAPKSEPNLGARNNRVEDGQTFPSVSNF